MFREAFHMMNANESPFLNSATIEALARFDTPTIANALETLGIPASPPVGPDIRAFTPILKPLVGIAVTGTSSEKRGGTWEHLEGWIRFLEAIEATPLPVVAVLQDTSQRPGREAQIGEGMSRAMRACGAVGVISDAVNRDIQQLREMGFPLICRGLAADRGAIRFHRYQVAVRIGELTVHPGDLIHADENGVLSIPADRVDDILRAAGQVAEREAGFFPLFSRPDFKVALLRDRYRDALASAQDEKEGAGEHG
jgi:4-hydroxy-4-methyl-2-oxoglutarate aldolase